MEDGIKKKLLPKLAYYHLSPGQFGNTDLKKVKTSHPNMLLSQQEKENLLYVRILSLNFCKSVL